MSALPPPPKFASATTGQGPSTVEEWQQFIRWLYKLYEHTVENIGTAQSISFGAQAQSLVGPQAENVLGTAQVLRQLPLPIRPAEGMPQGPAQPPRHANELDALAALAMTRIPSRAQLQFVIEDTHANRSSYSAVNVGQLYWETDRKVFYVSLGGVWRYASGVMIDLRVNKPSDLGSDDYGFLFLEVNNDFLSWWNGSVFAESDPMTALGDMVYRDSYGPARLAGDTTNKRTFLMSLSIGGVAQAPTWGTILELPSIVSNGGKTLKVNSGATGVEWV